MCRMFRSVVCRYILIGIWLAGMLLGGALTTQAQEVQQPEEPALVVIPDRIIDAIQRDLDNTFATRDLAMERRTLAEERLRSIDPTLATKKQQLNELDRRKDEAKRAKRGSELISIEAEKRASKQVIDLLNRLKELRKAEVEVAAAEIQLAEAQTQVYQLEMELSRKRADQAALAQSNSGVLNQGAATQVVNELGTRLLKLQEEQANATQKLAAKQKDVVSRRMNLIKAQVKLGAT